MIDGIDCKVIVVGGGPIGLYTSYLIKKNNPDLFVIVIDNHKKIGSSVCCSGLIGINGYNKTKLSKLVSLNDFLVNKIKGANIYSSLKTKFIVAPSEYKAYVINRSLFDKKIAELAISVGVIIENYKTVTKVNDKSVVVKDLKTNASQEVGFDYLIGADGPNSIVKESIVLENQLNDYNNKEFIHAYQVVVSGKFNKEKVKVYFGNFAKGLFAWIIPESTTVARIGIGTSLGHNPKLSFEKFIKKFDLKFNSKISECSGILPISKPLNNIATTNKIVVGDAASFVKATTGGGINFGLISAEMAEKAISERINNFKPLNSINGLLSKNIKELKVHYKIKNIILSKTDVEFDEFLQKLNKLEINKVLEKTGDMDYILSFLKNIVLKPKYFLFVMKEYKDLIKFLR